ncbi:40S ribosomal protein S29-like [Prionailurus viverrinus]|uniref:40S ribosomal protein S29-like n=1 Tax=Prionailurus viverrinus TaxID=61388 RepID=UPI001FF5DD15|nr:40S ribosomal protein S29-like [Prionailurus viverrinus]
MGHQELYCGHPRKFGLGCHSCPICTNQQGLMWKYCVTMCLQGLLQYGKNMGFIKLDYVSHLEWVLQDTYCNAYSLYIK